MYKRFFNLRTNPFNITPDPRFLYRMPHTLEALACLRYGISERRGFIVLTGEVGTGKTTLINTALQSFDQNKIVSSFIFNPRVDAAEFLEFVMADFGIAPVSRSKAAMLMQLNRWLIERYKRNEVCVVIVDEAQNLSMDVLEEIRLLTNLETASDKLLQIVLSGQPEFEEKLREPAVRQLRQRVAMWCRTQTLTLEETGAYIAERLTIAGGQGEIFPAESVELVHDLSRGIPRTINLLCEHALISTYAEGARVATPEVIEAVGNDLGLSVRLLPGSARFMAGRPGLRDAVAAPNENGRPSPSPFEERKEIDSHE